MLEGLKELVLTESVCLPAHWQKLLSAIHMLQYARYTCRFEAQSSRTRKDSAANQISSEEQFLAYSLVVSEIRLSINYSPNEHPLTSNSWLCRLGDYALCLQQSWKAISCLQRCQPRESARNQLEHQNEESSSQPLQPKDNAICDVPGSDFLLTVMSSQRSRSQPIIPSSARVKIEIPRKDHHHQNYHQKLTSSIQLNNPLRP